MSRTTVFSRLDDGTIPGIQRFLGVMACSTLLMVSAVIAFNWWMDPLGKFAHSDSRGADTSILQSKLRLVRTAKDADLVVLGSSRMHYYDGRAVPALRGQRVLNLAIDAGFPNAELAMMQLIDAQTADTDFPNVVIGIGLEELWNRALVPEFYEQQWVASTLGYSHRQSRWDRIQADWFPLATLQTTRASLRGLREQQSDVKFTVNDRGVLTDGTQIRHARNGTSQADWDEARQSYAAIYKRTDGRAVFSIQAQRSIDHMLALASKRGVEPIVVLHPMYRPMQRELGPLGRDATHRQVIDFLNREHRRWTFTLVDLSMDTALGPHRRDWYDGVHPSPETSARIFRRVAGALHSGSAAHAL